MLVLKIMVENTLIDAVDCWFLFLVMIFTHISTNTEKNRCTHPVHTPRGSYSEIRAARPT